MGSINNVPMSGWIVFESCGQKLCIGGLYQVVDAHEVTVKVLTVQNNRPPSIPLLRICAEYITTIPDCDGKDYLKDEVYFDIYSTDIRQFTFQNLEELANEIPEHLACDPSFLEYGELLEPLKVRYDLVHVNGIDRAIELAAPVQKEALEKLGHLRWATSFTFYSRRKKALRQMVKNMNDYCVSLHPI
ncbi:hypothetical protein MMC19_004117 [Ptychographa xylographoides]|nr:hypothetical protein [Ptychographa xylographoides]